MTNPMKLMAAGALALALAVGSCDPLCGCERPAAGTVRGQVMDENEAGIADAVVELSGSGVPGLRTAVTGADGRYEFLVVEAQTDVSLRLQVPAGWVMAPGSANPVTAFLADELTVVVDFRMRPAP